MDIPFRREVSNFLVLLVLVLTTASSAWGQAELGGRLRGTVTDPQGAAVVGATVTLKNPEAGVSAPAALLSATQIFYVAGLPSTGTHGTTAGVRQHQQLARNQPGSYTSRIRPTAAANPAILFFISFFKNL